jgi:predicted Zn-ribbon and HTH transcriptional regulator
LSEKEIVVQVETVSAEKNKLGKTLEDYKCENCGYLHTTLFLNNLPLKRCYRCRAKEGKRKVV